MKYVGGKVENLSNVESLTLVDIENIMKGFGYSDVLSVACAVKGMYVPIRVDMLFQFVETEEECEKMMEDALKFCFLKLYVENFIRQEAITETMPMGNNKTELHNVNVTSEGAKDSYDADYVLSESGDDDDSLSSDAGNSDVDDEMMITRQNKKLFKKTIVDHGYGLGLDRVENRGNSGTNRSLKLYRNATNEDGYQSEYPDSDDEVLTPESSDEDDMEVRIRTGKKTFSYNPNCDHSQLQFAPGMMFTNAEQFR